MSSDFTAALPAVGGGAVSSRGVNLASPEPPKLIGFSSEEQECYEYLCKVLREAGIEHMTAGIPLAGPAQPTRLTGSMEILTLSGTVAAGGDKTASHMHMAISTATGQVIGGHVAPGCIVLTTAEVLLALLPDWQFTREPDSLTGYDELVIRPQS